MKEEILQLTKKLMLIHSTKENSQALQEALDVVKKELDSFGTIEEFESNGTKSLLIHNREAGTKDFKIILNAHVDVVAAKKHQFEPVEKDGKLYGRGSYDMKAALAVMILLFKKLSKELSYPLALQVVSDEEFGGFNGVHYQLQQGIRAEFAITGDCGSDLKVVNEAKGIMWLKLHAKGTKAHGAYLWRGDNALWKIHVALANLHKLFPVPDEAAWQTTMNLAKIETDNNAFNHVPEGASAYLDFRFIPEDEHDLKDKIIKAVPSDMEIEVLFCDSPEYVSPDNSFVKQLQNAATDVTKTETELIKVHAPSDIRHFHAFNCPGVGFGAKGVHQHADDEWVDIQSLEDYFVILEKFLTKIA